MARTARKPQRAVPGTALLTVPRVLALLALLLTLRLGYSALRPAARGTGPPAKEDRRDSPAPAARPFDNPRAVVKVKVASEPHGGGGVKIWGGGISRADYNLTDPFLMLDEAKISPPGGFPDHPHRGFETVTYVIDGAMSHEDFEGHAGILHSGDVQVTARAPHRSSTKGFGA